MSFQAAKELVKRNTKSKKETIATPTLKEENPLLQQYKKQEERIAALSKEKEKIRKRE